jgi:beta-galactosidase
VFYRGLLDSGIAVSVVQPEQLGPDVAAFVTRHPVLLTPALYVADDGLLAFLERYAALGGHLVLTFRSAVADGEGRLRSEALPASLARPAGIRIMESTTIVGRVPVLAGDALAGDAREARGTRDAAGGATGWADAIDVGRGTVVAGYDHPHLGRWPAITTNVHERGRISYVGTLPDPELGRWIGDWITRISLAPDQWRLRHASLTSFGARTRDGGRLRFISNWSWQPRELPAPAAARDLLTGQSFGAGDLITLGPWDVRVLSVYLA